MEIRDSLVGKPPEPSSKYFNQNQVIEEKSSTEKVALKVFNPTYDTYFSDKEPIELKNLPSFILYLKEDKVFMNLLNEKETYETVELGRLQPLNPQAIQYQTDILKRMQFAHILDAESNQEVTLLNKAVSIIQRRKNKQAGEREIIKNHAQQVKDEKVLSEQFDDLIKALNQKPVNISQINCHFQAIIALIKNGYLSKDIPLDSSLEEIEKSIEIIQSEVDQNHFKKSLAYIKHLLEMNACKAYLPHLSDKIAIDILKNRKDITNPYNKWMGSALLILSIYITNHFLKTNHDEKILQKMKSDLGLKDEEKIEAKHLFIIRNSLSLPHTLDNKTKLPASNLLPYAVTNGENSNFYIHYDLKDKKWRMNASGIDELFQEAETLQEFFTLNFRNNQLKHNLVPLDCLTQDLLTCIKYDSDTKILYKSNGYSLELATDL